MISSNRGFTLIELLISLSIMAFIGIVAFELIGSGYRVQTRVQEASSTLDDTARIWLKIQTDFKQVVDRPIRDNQGEQEASMVLSNGVLHLTRAGWSNPLKKERSQYQRLEYSLNSNQLNRLFWEELDRSPDSEPKIQVFQNVTEFDVEVLTREGEWIRSWPLLDEKGEVIPGLPLAIQITLGINNAPPFTRLFELVSYYNEEETN